MSVDSKPKGRLMNQKDIQQEYGLSTRDVLRGVAANQFPAPVRVIGKKRWFDRAEIARFFRVQRPEGGSGPAA
jgi:predicted DNA-binding transcriptional regulator AlpA